jgi:hypothetical protein
LSVDFDKYSLLGCTIFGFPQGLPLLGPDEPLVATSNNYLIDYVIRADDRENYLGRSKVGDKFNALMKGWGGASSTVAAFASLSCFESKQITPVGKAPLSSEDRGALQELDFFWHGRTPLAVVASPGDVRFGELFNIGMNGGLFGADGLSFAGGLSDHLQSLYPLTLMNATPPVPGGGGGELPPAWGDGLIPLTHGSQTGVSVWIAGLGFIVAGAAGFLLVKQLRKAGL